MHTSSPTIPPETARHVLWTFGREDGYRPGTFTQKLLELLAYADPGNTAKLAAAFPAEAEAVRLAKYDEAGVERLQDIANLRCTRCKKDDGPNTPSGLCEACARPVPLDGVA